MIFKKRKKLDIIKKIPETIFTFTLRSVKLVNFECEKMHHLLHAVVKCKVCQFDEFFEYAKMHHLLRAAVKCKTRQFDEFFKCVKMHHFLREGSKCKLVYLTSFKSLKNAAFIS